MEEPRDIMMVMERKAVGGSEADLIGNINRKNRRKGGSVRCSWASGLWTVKSLLTWEHCLRTS